MLGSFFPTNVPRDPRERSRFAESLAWSDLDIDDTRRAALLLEAADSQIRSGHAYSTDLLTRSEVFAHGIADARQRVEALRVIAETRDAAGLDAEPHLATALAATEQIADPRTRAKIREQIEALRTSVLARQGAAGGALTRRHIQQTLREYPSAALTYVLPDAKERARLLESDDVRTQELTRVLAHVSANRDRRRREEQRIEWEYQQRRAHSAGRQELREAFTYSWALEFNCPDTDAAETGVSVIPGSGRVRAHESISAPYASAGRPAPSAERLSEFFHEEVDGLFFDLDGTLIDQYRDSFSPVERRLRLLASVGVPIAIATGRSAHSVQQTIFPHAAAFPGMRIYGRNGMENIVSVDGRWAKLDTIYPEESFVTTERQESIRRMHGILKEYVAEGARRQSCNAEYFRAQVESITPHEKKLILSIQTRFRSIADEATLSTGSMELLAELIRERLGAAFSADFTIVCCGDALQISHTETGKAACLTDFLQTDPQLKAASRGGKQNLKIVRFGDQAQRSGNDGTVVDHPHGCPVLPNAPDCRGLPLPFDRSRGVNWVLDNLQYSMLDRECLYLIPSGCVICGDECYERSEPEMCWSEDEGY